MTQHISSITTPQPGTEPEGASLEALLGLSGACGEQRTLLRKGLAFLIRQGVCPPSSELYPILVEQLIADIDETLSAQMNAILHHERFQQLESAWRSLKGLVDRIDFRQNIRVELLDVSKEALLDDFDDAPQVTRSGLYHQVYVREYGQFGGQPIGAVIGNYFFRSTPEDIRLLSQIAAVSAMAHAPFIAGADRSFFGVGSWEDLPNLKSLRSVFEMPQYARWNTFRQSADARYVGLALPCFLLRKPYDGNWEAFGFRFFEDTSSPSAFCWGNAAFALAGCLARSFALYRWSVNIVGAEDGAVEGLPLCSYESTGSLQSKIPTEILVSERREYELCEEGFIALTMRKGSENAAFFSCNTCRNAKDESRDEALASQLPYMMLITRLAHYLKVLQRENIGAWKERSDIERELNRWIAQYVAKMEDPDPETRSRRPLKAAAVTVSEDEANPGWYAVHLMVSPHIKYMGMGFTLQLSGKLDRN